MDFIELNSSKNMMYYNYGTLKALNKLNIKPKEVISDNNNFLLSYLYTKPFWFKMYFESKLFNKNNIIKKRLSFYDYITSNYYLSVIDSNFTINQSSLTESEYNRLIYNKSNHFIDISYAELKLNYNYKTYVFKSPSLINSYDKKYLINKAYYSTLRSFNKIEGNKYFFKKGSLNKLYKKYYKSFLKNLFFLASDAKVIFKINYINNLLDERNRKFFYNFIEDIAMMFKLDDSILYSYRSFNKALKKKYLKLKKDSSLNINKIKDLEDDEITAVLSSYLEKNNIIKRYPIHFINAIYLEML